jgi:hypothetical protein
MAAHQGGSAGGLGSENRYQGNAIPCYVGDSSLFSASSRIGIKMVEIQVYSAPSRKPAGDFGTRLVKFPVFFPVSREFGLESGSLETPSTAIEFLKSVTYF